MSAGVLTVCMWLAGSSTASFSHYSSQKYEKVASGALKLSGSALYLFYALFFGAVIDPFGASFSVTCVPQCPLLTSYHRCVNADVATIL